ncbi:putative P-loop containing nucleoside triphosphate hydrolase protein [Seiridium cardinale]
MSEVLPATYQAPESDLAPPLPSSTEVPSSTARDYLGGFEPEETDVVIALMGVTGSGKSTFISQCTEEEVKVGHDLESCTQDVGVYRCHFPNSAANVYLIDTPGFDDTNRSDTDVLKGIAEWLAGSYQKNILLDGILYLHRIDEPRMQGSARRNLNLFGKLCGTDPLKKVTLVTTRWDKVTEPEGSSREQELTTKEEFWGHLVSKGAQTYRHRNDVESARELIETFVVNKTGVSEITLAIQEQMVQCNRSLDDTDAGQELSGALLAAQLKFKKEVADVKYMMEEALRTRDKEAAEQLEREQAAMNLKLDKLNRDREELKVSLEKLQEERIARLERKIEVQRLNNHQLQEIQARQLDDLESKLEKEHEESVEVQGQLELYKKNFGQLGLYKSNTGENSSKSSLAISSSTMSSCGGLQASYMDLSLSICGSKFYFCGPDHDNFLGRIKKPPGNGIESRYITIGMSGSFYHHYREEGHCRTTTALGDQYPDLNELVEERQYHGCPSFVSLGPDGTFYAKIENRRKVVAPRNASKAIDRGWDRVERAWFGYDDTYLIEFKNGNLSWDFGDYYQGLDEKIRQRKSSGILDVALNLEGPAGFVIVWECGYSAVQNPSWYMNIEKPFTMFMEKNGARTKPDICKA